MKKQKGFTVAAGKCKRTNGDVRHTDCKKGGKKGGAIAVTGEGHGNMRIGFGFRGSKFVVDLVRQKVYTGFCMNCHKEGQFVVEGKGRIVTKTPRSINNKIRQAQASV